jgi:predicted phage tail protein
MSRKSATRHLMLLLGLCVLSMAPTCGKRRPPLPPVERIPQRTELLSGAQRGNQVILSWPAPRRNASSGSVQSIRRVDLYRVAEKPSAPLPMTEDEFAARATLIGSVTYEEIQNATAELTYTDSLELAGEPSRLRYAVRYVNAAGQRAAFSNFLLIEPTARVSEPPTNARAELSETAITLGWEAPKQNIDGSTPVNLLGYNVYRVTASQSEAGQTPINQGLVATPQYQDRNFKFGEKYTYVVRAVSLGTLARPVESLNSNSVNAEPVDIYPPSPPKGLSVAQAPGRLSLFFAANPESDVAGYLIYRSTDLNLPKPWTLLTSALWTRITFHDENVDPGKTYYYYVIAVDTAGNKSAPSEVVSETAT